MGTLRSQPQTPRGRDEAAPRGIERTFNGPAGLACAAQANFPLGLGEGTPPCPHPRPGAMKCRGALPTPCPRPVVCAGCQSKGSSGKAASRTCRAESIQEEAAEEEEQAGMSAGPNPGAFPEIGDPSVW